MAGVVEGFGAGSLGASVPGQALTPGTAVVGAQAKIGSVVSKFSWTNAQIVALGAVLSGNIALCTLPAKTIVKRVLINITGTAAGTTTLTVSMGRTAATFLDYIIASNAQVGANTVYGDATGELGTSMSTFVGDLPSMTATTLVNLQFVSTVQNLDQCTGSTGDCWLETITLP